MGVETKRPPLPAPTNSSLDNSSTSTVDATDVATNISRRTDRSSYSLPEDGSPVTLATTKARAEPGSSHSKSQSQPAVLIEYFVPSKSGESGSSRPSVRVKVASSGGKKSKTGDAVKITEVGGERKPSYTRRISLSGNNPKQRSRAIDTTNTKELETGEAPIEVELVNNNPTEVSSAHAASPRFVAAASDISSMPADSMLDEPITIQPPERKGSRGLEQLDQEEVAMEVAEPVKDTLKAPATGRSRSVSRERIAHKVIEKLYQDRSPELASASNNPLKARDMGTSKDLSEENLKASSRRSSKSRRESGTESSLVRPRDGDSAVSSNSKVSLNNPKLLQMVEDTIRRLILPEIQDIKRQQSIRSSRNRDSMITESGVSQDELDRRLSKSSSAVKSKSDLSREEREHGEKGSAELTRHKKARRSSRDATSEKTSRRRDSTDATSREHTRERRHRSKDSARSDETGSRSLTAAALRDHESEERRERRKKRGKSRSQTDSIGNTEEGTRDVSQMPVLPLAGGGTDSELTRDSILSAESNESTQGELTTTRGLDPPIQEVARGSPRLVPLPVSRPSTRTPSAQRKVEASPVSAVSSRPTSQQRLRGARSDKSISSKSTAALAATGLGGAAAALYGYDNGRASSRQSERRERTPGDRTITPAQSLPTPEKKEASVSSPEATERNLALESPREEATLKAPRPPGALFYADTPEDEQKTFKDADMTEFYEEQRLLNDQYRSSVEYDSQRDSSALDLDRSPPKNDSFDEAYSGQAASGPQVRGIAANPEYVAAPPAPSSAVASLLENSLGSSGPSELSLAKDGGGQPNMAQAGTRGMQQSASLGSLPSNEDSSSRDRWSLLRENAKALSNTSKEQVGAYSPHQSAARSIESQEHIQMGASGVPNPDDPMPEIGHGLDDTSDSDTHRSMERKHSSVLEGPLGDERENRDHWPYQPTPPVSKRQGFVDPGDHDEQYISAGNAALMGAAAGAAAGLGIGAVGARQFSEKNRELTKEHSSSSRSPDELRGDTLSDPAQVRDLIDSQGNMKDEGYISAAQPRSPGIASPISFSKEPPRLFDDRDLAGYEPAPPTEEHPAHRQPDPFVGSKRTRYLSGNSHGMQSPIFDATTGRGINHIQSKDVVALMDHLTVRDGQRNARDTEILVTLVRSAAEMRTNFEDIKKFIEAQNQASANRVIDETKARAFVSPRPMQRVATAEGEEAGNKKKNIFKRALKGLGSKSNSDLARIEDMLLNLLGEVESLKTASGYTAPAPMARTASLDTYERLRAAPESGYEPEGQAGTGSTPNRSGNFSASPLSRQIPGRYSGYDMRRDSEKRVSTVMEDDENQDEYDRYENKDGMLTPTQEAQHQRSVQYATPPRQGQHGTLSNDVTPDTGGTGDGGRKQKSNSSSLWGIPRISRWSKTTASSGAENRRDTVFTDASRSGSDVNVLPPAEGYLRSDDDRIRSANSLARENGELPPRSPSPLIPDQVAARIEDPKYQSKHNSILLQHPQPRQASTHRHQNNLEYQAYDYGDGAPEDVVSPVSEVFGSVPALARLSGGYGHRGGAHGHGNMSPISSHSGYSAGSGNENIHQAEVQRAWAPGPARPPKVRADDLPLVPPKVPYDRNVARESNAVAAATAPLHGRRGAPPPPAPTTAEEWNEYLDREDDAAWADDPAIPLERKRSPYSPGGLLAPIEERYSMEGDRASVARTQSQRSAGVQSLGSFSGPRDHRRFSYEIAGVPAERDSLMVAGNVAAARGAAHAPGQERAVPPPAAAMDEEERSGSPTLAPRPALGATTADIGARKLTGPREMPARNASGTRTVSGGSLMGTLRRKPQATFTDDDYD